MEERIQNLIQSLEDIKSNPALDTEEYKLKPELKSKITVELKAIQTDLLKSISDFALSFNLNLESSTIPPDTQEPPPPPPPAEAAEEEGEQKQEAPAAAVATTAAEEELPTEEGKDNMGDDFDVDNNEEDPFVGGNRKQKTKKNKRRSQKNTQKNRKNN